MIVQGKRTILFSPEDRINAPRLEQIALARHAVYGHAYAFSLSGIATLIQAQAAKGVKHFWIFDHSQYMSGYNPHMKTVVDSLIGAKNVVVYLATMPDGSIAHDKFAVIDNKMVQFGSQNYTGDSERQSGHVIIESGRVIARGFMTHWQHIVQSATILAAPIERTVATFVPAER